MRNEPVSYAIKHVECDKCGRVTYIPKYHPLKLAWCKECGSARIRLYKSPADQIPIK